jgi:hypothetical protein
MCRFPTITPAAECSWQRARRWADIEVAQFEGSEDGGSGSEFEAEHHENDEVPPNEN